MNWTNYHGHCNYCDGKGEPEVYVIEAIKNKMSAIGFSSHAPVPFESFWNMPQDKLKAYLEEIDRLKLAYQDKITVYKSLEVDYIEGMMGPRTDSINSLSLDYVIGSVHFLGQFQSGEYWAIDGSFESFMAGLEDIFQGDIKKAVKEFYKQQKQMVLQQTPDIIGHLDKIKMHNKTQLLFDEQETWYQDEIRQLLEIIAQKDCIVEINTKSYQRNGLLFPGVEYFKWLKELKIPIVINSDAHYPEYLEAGFRDVAKILKDNGVFELFVLKNGVWNGSGYNEGGILL